MPAILNPEALPQDAERHLRQTHEATMNELLAALGPLIAAAVFLFGLWDYVTDPVNAPWTLLVRAGAVVLGSIAFRPGRLRWSSEQRCIYVYWLFSCTVILCNFILRDGFLYGLVGVVAGLFFVSVILMSNRTFLVTVSLPFALFVALSAFTAPLFEFANGIVSYLLSAIIAFVLMAMIRFLRRKAALLEEELRRQASHDSLTGLLNRARLNELAVREMALAERHSRPLAILMLDIDHFKLVNDTYGHDVGDRVIIRLADVCREQLREIDHVGRFGGEEFVCILPETDRDAALACAERLRAAVEALCVESAKGGVRFTVSIGIALRGIAHKNWEALLKDADTALYQAKQNGRNRIELAEARGGDRFVQNLS